MVVYSIKDIEKLTGVKAHTIRIWEKRYEIIVPKRTKTNIRYYLESDLKDIINIAFLNKNGYKISKIVNLKPEERKKIAAEISKIDTAFENQIDAITFSILELDEQSLSHIFDQHIKQQGFENTMVNIINPLLEKLWVMWMAGSMSGVHERFVSQLLLRKSILAINSLPPPSGTYKGKIIVYLPEDENHELSLYYLHFLLMKNNYRVINLGKGINLSNILNAYQIVKPDYIFAIINDSFENKPLQPYLETICNTISCDLIISGYQPLRQTIKTPTNCKLLSSIEDVQKHFKL